jgi:hypothetical protein
MREEETKTKHYYNKNFKLYFQSEEQLTNLSQPTDNSRWSNSGSQIAKQEKMRIQYIPL